MQIPQEEETILEYVNRQKATIHDNIHVKKLHSFHKINLNGVVLWSMLGKVSTFLFLNTSLNSWY
jgi:hypothetical protein